MKPFYYIFKDRFVRVSERDGKMIEQIISHNHYSEEEYTGLPTYATHCDRVDFVMAFDRMLNTMIRLEKQIDLEENNEIAAAVVVRRAL